MYYNNNSIIIAIRFNGAETNYMYGIAHTLGILQV